MNITKGGLAPAKIKNLETEEEVSFMFNPFEFTLTKQNTWNENKEIGRNIPKMEFQGGGGVDVKLALHFDTQSSGGDVRQHTDALWKMMMVSSQNTNATTNKSLPPAIVFEWGPVYLKAVITTMAQKFTLFSDKGVPLRCTVDVTLKQYAEESDSQSQIPGLPPGQGTTPTTTMTDGQRIDHVNTDMRSVAAKNNIDNPLKIPTGTNLRK
jgi:hypothetical protein